MFTCSKCNHTWYPSRVEPPKRCPNHSCRTLRWNSSPIKPVADFPIENKKNSAASPNLEINPFTALVEKRLHPERTDAERLAIIEELKPKADKENYKTKSVIDTWPTKPVEDQPSYDDYGPTIT